MLLPISRFVILLGRDANSQAAHRGALAAMAVGQMPAQCQPAEPGEQQQDHKAQQMTHQWRTKKTASASRPETNATMMSLVTLRNSRRYRPNRRWPLATAMTSPIMAAAVRTGRQQCQVRQAAVGTRMVFVACDQCRGGAVAIEPG